MSEDNLVVDGSAIFKKRKVTERPTVNGQTADENNDIKITDITGNAGSADKLSLEGKALARLLFSMLHCYPNDYVPEDTSNVGWSGLGLCIIYYTIANRFKNQPSQWGQLINIPPSLDSSECMQIFIVQPSGIIYTRGGNGSIVLNDTAFKQLAFSS